MHADGQVHCSPNTVPFFSALAAVSNDGDYTCDYTLRLQPHGESLQLPVLPL